MEVKKHVLLKTNRNFSASRLPSISFLFMGRRKGVEQNVPVPSHVPFVPRLLPETGGGPSRMEVKQKVSLETNQDFIVFRILPILFLQAEEEGRGAKQNGT